MWVMKRVGAAPCQWSLAGLEEHAITGPDDLDRAAAALAEPDTLGDIDRLAEGMGVPCGSGAGREVDAGGLQAGGLRCRGEGVDVDGAAEPLGRPDRGLG
jgi:hypothetical protein